MSKLEKKEFCAFHYKTKSDGTCSRCGLSICQLDQDYNENVERICPLCANSVKNKGKMRLINMLVWTLILAFPVLWITTDIDFYYLMFGVIAFFGLLNYVLKPLMLKVNFSGLEKNEMILPLLQYFEATGNEDYYDYFIKYLSKLSNDTLQEMKPYLLRYLVPAIIFNYTKLPEDWDAKLLTSLNYTEKEFAKLIITDYRNLVLRIAVNHCEPEVSKFILYLGKVTGDEEFIKEYIREITSDEIMDLEEKEIKSLYNKLLEELFVYEKTFYELCDKYELNKEKERIQELLSIYDPPAVPNSMLEAMLPQEQIDLKRKQQELGTNSEMNLELDVEQPD